MASRELDIRSGGDVGFVRAFELDGVAVRLRLRWFPRVRRWFCEVWNADDVAIVQPQLVGPGAPLIWDSRRADVPDGYLYWFGDDDYDRDDMGTALRLFYVQREPEPEVEPYTVIVATGYTP